MTFDTQMAVCEWFASLSNAIRTQNKENASIVVNVDGILNELCIDNYIWRYHEQLESWVYAIADVHKRLNSLTEIFIYCVESEFCNTFCITDQPLKVAWSFGWTCIYSKSPEKLASATRRKSLTKTTSTDLSIRMRQMRLKRRRSSLPCCLEIRKT